MQMLFEYLDSCRVAERLWITYMITTYFIP